MNITKPLTYQDKVSLIKTILVVCFYLFLTLATKFFGINVNMVVIATIHLLIYWGYKFSKAFINNNLVLMDLKNNPNQKIIFSPSIKRLLVEPTLFVVHRTKNHNGFYWHLTLMRLSFCK